MIGFVTCVQDESTFHAVARLNSSLGMIAFLTPGVKFPADVVGAMQVVSVSKCGAVEAFSALGECDNISQ